MPEYYDWWLDNSQCSKSLWIMSLTVFIKMLQDQQSQPFAAWCHPGISRLAYRHVITPSGIYLILCRPRLIASLEWRWLAITTQIIDCNYEPCIVAYAVYILISSRTVRGRGMGIDYLMPGYGRLRSLRSWDDLFLQNPRSLIERFHPDLDLVCCNT